MYIEPDQMKSLTKEEIAKAYEELRQLDTAKSEYISVAVHQLRTPLSAVKWMLGLLVNGDLGPLTADQKTYLLQTEEANNHIVSLVNDLLSVEKIQSAEDQYVFVSANPGSLLESALAVFSLQIRQKGLKVEFVSDPAMIRLPLDVERMKSVFQNLIENVIKYSKKNGTLAASVKSESGKIVITISDSGIGIPADQQKHVFERFFRARNAISYSPDGTGLGLYICKKIIEKHSGTIAFESKEGAGTTFVITLPISKS